MISGFLNSTLWLDIEEWTISWTIGGTNWFPLLESIHVIAAAMVVGTILWVDLRLIGVAAVQYPITTMSRELVPWTWGFCGCYDHWHRHVYYASCITCFKSGIPIKMVLLVLAGLNMAYFHFKLYKDIAQCDSLAVTSTQLKIAGSLSLFLWAGVMLAGRWIGHII